MADETPETGTDNDAPETGDDETTEDNEQSAGADVALKKANREAAGYRKQLRETQKRLKEIEDRDKSEAEKQTERVTAAEKRAEAAELKALRFDVAQTKGLTATQAKRLVGESREELEADADELLKDLKANTKPADLKQGNRGSASSDDPDAWLRRMAGRR